MFYTVIVFRYVHDLLPAKNCVIRRGCKNRINASEASTKRRKGVEGVKEEFYHGTCIAVQQQYYYTDQIVKSRIM